MSLALSSGSFVQSDNVGDKHVLVVDCEVDWTEESAPFADNVEDPAVEDACDLLMHHRR